MKTSSNYIDTITPLRGIAALLVCLFHYDELLFFSGLPRIVNIENSSFVHNGYLWVDFFFILSGFVITHVYADKLQNWNGTNIKKYIWARFTRLYPMHLFTMILIAIIYHIIVYNFPDFAKNNFWAQASTFNNFVAHLFFLQNTPLNNPVAWNVPSWSIAAEWWVYIVAILIIPFLNKRAVMLKNISAFIVALAGLFIISQNGSLNLTLELGILRCLFGFIIGIVVYQVYKTMKNFNKSIFNSDIALILSCLVVVFLNHLDLYDFITIPFFALIILSASLNNGTSKRVLNIKPLQFLGDISYSFYLLHLLILIIWWLWIQVAFIPENPEVSPTIWNHFTWLFIIYASTIIIAYLTHRFVEVPARGIFKKELHQKPEATQLHQNSMAPVESSLILATINNMKKGKE